jgi:hypothetical protein
MKAYGEVDVYIHIFFTSPLAVGEWSASRPCRFTTGERTPGTQWIGGWVDSTAGLDDVEKRTLLTLPGLEIRALACPARSQSLYRLRYPGFEYGNNIMFNCFVYGKTEVALRKGKRILLEDFELIRIRSPDVQYWVYSLKEPTHVTLKWINSRGRCDS